MKRNQKRCLNGKCPMTAEERKAAKKRYRAAVMAASARIRNTGRRAA